MKKSKSIIAFALIGLLLVAAGGAGVWWWQSRQAPAGAQATAKPAPDKQEYKYLTLDKVIVMLRGQTGQPLSHYLAVDLVFKTIATKEKTVKEHMPLLRSIAVRSLSAYSLDKAMQMSVEQLAEEINAAYTAAYAADNHEKPFTEAMIGKLIIE